jgi:hypothetical protein
MNLQVQIIEDVVAVAVVVDVEEEISIETMILTHPKEVIVGEMMAIMVEEEDGLIEMIKEMDYHVVEVEEVVGVEEVGLLIITLMMEMVSAVRVINLLCLISLDQHIYLQN